MAIEAIDLEKTEPAFHHNKTIHFKLTKIHKQGEHYANIRRKLLKI